MSNSKRSSSEDYDSNCPKRSKLVDLDIRHNLDKSISDILNNSIQPNDNFEGSFILSPLVGDIKRKKISLSNRQLNNRKSLTHFKISEKNKNDSQKEQQLIPCDPKEFSVNLNSLHEINSKSFNPSKAFNYNFINVIDSFINNDKGKVDFKIIALSLDAGTKIYVSKVQLVYCNTQKISSSLSMATEDQKNFIDDEDGFFDDDNYQKNADSKKKRRKQKKNVNTIVSNVETLNSKLETNIEIDPLFYHLSAAFDVGNVNSLLMANLNVNPYGVMLLDSNTNLNFDETEPLQKTSMDFSFPSEFSNCPQSEKFICKHYKNFEFLNRDNLQDINSKPTQIETNLNFDFDINADVEDVNEPDEFDFNDHFNNSNLNVSNLNLSNSSNEDCNQNDALTDEPIMEDFDSENILKILPDNNEYNQFFNKNFLKRVFKNVSRYRSLRTNQTNISSKKPKTRVAYKENKYDINISDNLFKSSDNITFTETTLKKWTQNAKDRRLEDDTGFNKNHLKMCFARQNDFYSLMAGIQTKKTDTNTDLLDISVNDNEFSNNEDCRHDDDYSLDLSPPGFDLESNTDKIDEEPMHIDALDIDYAKVAKKIDIKKVKNGMWDVIKKESADTSLTIHQSEEISETLSSQSKALTFADLRLNLPSRLSSNLNENLSTPISFVALLHLCNEKNLALKPQDRLSNFIIQSEII